MTKLTSCQLVFSHGGVFYSVVNLPLSGGARSVYEQCDIVSSPVAGSHCDAGAGGHIL